MGREPTRNELADAAGMPLARIDEALEHPRADVSLNQTLGGDDPVELGELISDPGADDPLAVVDSELRQEAITRVLGALPPCERVVVERRFGLTGVPQTLQAIAGDLGVTRERVRQIESHALAELAHEPVLRGIAAASSRRPEPWNPVWAPGRPA